MNIDDDSQYFSTPRRKNHIVPEPGANNEFSEQVHLVCDSLKFPIKLITNATSHKLTPHGKEFFPNLRKKRIGSKVGQVKSLKIFVEGIISIEQFEQQCVILKGALKPDQLKQNMVTTGFNRLLKNIALYEHRCSESIRNCINMLVNVTTNISIKSYLKHPL